jgi:hypothetical protein
MSAIADLTTLPTTVVTAERQGVTDVGNQVVYTRGKFAQALAKVQSNPNVLETLQSEGELAAPVADRLASLMQASTAGSTTDTASPQAAGALKQFQQTLQASLQAGGQQAVQASRVSFTA